eukprot:scaffold32744_cov64-Phaeocystis_antarctica.AAC.1
MPSTHITSCACACACVVHVRLLPGQLAPLTVAILLANALLGERAQGHHPAALLSLWLYLTITLLGERAQGDHPAALRLHSAHMCGSRVENTQGCSLRTLKAAVLYLALSVLDKAAYLAFGQLLAEAPFSASYHARPLSAPATMPGPFQRQLPCLTAYPKGQPRPQPRTLSI